MFSYPDKRKTKLISCFVCVLLITVTLFSHFYLAVEAGHDCVGEDCPICSCMEICEGVLHQVSGASPLFVAIVLFLGIFLVLILPSVKIYVSDRSLISQKVRLDI